MRWKAIFFDAAGTLFESTRPVEEVYADFAKKYGVEVGAKEIGERFRAYFSTAPPLAFPGPTPGNISQLERRWWEDLVKRVFEPWRFPKFDAYFSELFDHFSRSGSWRLYPDTAETLSSLKAQGLILEVISNFDSRLFAILDGLKIASFFDAVIISSRAGYAKPAPEIFQKGLRLYGLRPADALHVGDSPETDLVAAQAAGLTGVLVDRVGRYVFQSTPRIENLKEIVSLLNRSDLTFP